MTDSTGPSEPTGSTEPTGPTDSTLTWRELWTETAAALGDRNHARWMCEVASGCDRDEFLDELDQPATQRMVAHLDAMIARRETGEPLQYVLGSWQFRTLDLMVDRRVLIPRPETEWVCEAALQLVAPMPHRPRRVADLGTGSGAIGLSIAAELPTDSVEVWIADVSSDALDVARANLAGIGRAAASVRVVQGSWFEALPADRRATFDLVIANPPYIAEGDPAVESSVLDHEPHLALFSGVDGLDDIRRIATDAPGWLAVDGWLVMEIGGTQGPAVATLLTTLEYRHVEIRQDLSNLDRTALAQRPTA